MDPALLARALAEQPHTGRRICSLLILPAGEPAGQGLALALEFPSQPAELLHEAARAAPAAAPLAPATLPGPSDDDDDDDVDVDLETLPTARDDLERLGRALGAAFRRITGR